MENVQDLVKGIRETISQTTSSRKDEIAVTKAMLNDKTYEVGVYTKDGKTETYNPSSAMRNFLATGMSKAAHLTIQEAKELANNHEFGNSEAQDVLGFSKELVNTYIHTGRKLPLGGRENSDIALGLKEVPAGERRFPTVKGIDENGKKIPGSGKTFVPAYETAKVYAPCPDWVKKANKK